MKVKDFTGKSKYYIKLVDKSPIKQPGMLKNKSSKINYN